MSIEGFGGPVAAVNDGRVNIDVQYGTPVADSDFSGGFASSGTTGNSTFRFDILASRPTLAVGDEINFIFQYSVEARSTSADMMIAAMCAADPAADVRATEPLCELFIKSTGAVYLKITAGGSSTSSSTVGSFFTTGTPKWLRIRFKRTGASTCEAELYVGNEALESWASNVSVTHSAWTSNPIQHCLAGLYDTFAKGDSMTHRVGITAEGLNETPLMAARVAFMVPDGDGSTLEWTPNTGSTHSTQVDDAIGSENTTDWVESGTAAADKTDEFTVSAMPAADAVHCVMHSVVQTVATGGSHLTVLLKLAGVESAEIDKTRWNSGTSTAIAIPFPTDPSGNAWTEDNVNATTMLIRRQSTSATNWRVTAVALGVYYTPAAAAGGNRRRALAQVA